MAEQQCLALSYEGEEAQASPNVKLPASLLLGFPILSLPAFLPYRGCAEPQVSKFPGTQT